MQTTHECQCVDPVPFDRDGDGIAEECRRCGMVLGTLECLEHGPECRGSVEYRMALSATGQSFPRCMKHWEARLREQDRINRLYAPDSDVPPVGFDPMDAGERWSDDY